MITYESLLLRTQNNPYVGLKGTGMYIFTLVSIDGTDIKMCDGKQCFDVVQLETGWGLEVPRQAEEKQKLIYFETFNELLVWYADARDCWVKV